MLQIALDKVCEIVVKARALGVNPEVIDPDYDSNASGEDIDGDSEGIPDEATFEELSQFIGALNVDEQIDLVALAWLGRDDFSIKEWVEAVAEASNAHEDKESESTAEYLLGIPLLAEYLEDGLSKHGLSCESYEPGEV